MDTNGIPVGRPIDIPYHARNGWPVEKLIVSIYYNVFKTINNNS